ncbi:MAG: UMP kinase [Candidatus Woesearchaeota archaeon]
MKAKTAGLQTVIISLGGSVIVPNEINVDFLKNFRRVILECIRLGKKILIVCGGGSTARKYMSSAAKVSRVSKEEEDLIGIMATKLNAQLVKTIFGRSAYEEILTDPNSRISGEHRLLIAAGYKPGCSTDYDAFLWAMRFRVRKIINVSNIDYVYDKDPSRFKDAKPLKYVSWKEFRKLVGSKWVPGMNMPFDPVASLNCEKHKIVVNIVGTRASNIKRAILGKEFEGTTIS